MDVIYPNRSIRVIFGRNRHQQPPQSMLRHTTIVLAHMPQGTHPPCYRTSSTHPVQPVYHRPTRTSLLQVLFSSYKQMTAIRSSQVPHTSQGILHKSRNFPFPFGFQPQILHDNFFIWFFWLRTNPLHIHYSLHSGAYCWPWTVHFFVFAFVRYNLTVLISLKNWNFSKKIMLNFKNQR